MDQEYQQLKNRTASGIKWNVLGQFISYFFTLVGTMVLSRLLTPGEFGLFAMITVLANLANLVVGMGLAHAVVQNRSLDQHDLSSIFWLNFLLGISVAIFFFLSSNWIANFYQQPELIDITRWFSIVFIVYGTSAVPLGLLTKSLDFKSLILSQVFATIASYAVSIGMAIQLMGVWSLLCHAIAFHVLNVAGNIYFSRWKPTFIFKTSAIAKIKRFSVNFLPSQLLDFFASNLDVLLVGKFFGKKDLGYYGRSNALVMLPVNALGFILNKTFFPIFSMLQNNLVALQNNYMMAVKSMTLLIMPLLIWIAIGAEEIVYVLYGPQWVEMSPLVTILSGYACINCYNNFNDSLIASQGRADLLLKVNLVEKSILIVGVFIGLSYGLQGIAYAKVLSVVLSFIPKMIVLTKVIKITWYDWFSSQRFLFIGLVFSGLAAYFTKILFVDSSVFVRLALLMISGGGFFLLFLFLIKEKSIKDFSRIFQKHFLNRL